MPKKPPKTTCSTCGRSYVYDPNRGHSRKRCNSCLANYGGQRARFKQRVLDYLGGSCKNCGYDKCAAALHPHHLDPAQKRFSIGGAKCRKWSEVQKELDKCTLLCANCHAEEHQRTRLPIIRVRKPERVSVEWPSRTTLKRMILRMPLTAIGLKLGVSGNAVKKRCIRLGVPTLGRKYWPKP